MKWRTYFNLVHDTIALKSFFVRKILAHSEWAPFVEIRSALFVFYFFWILLIFIGKLVLSLLGEVGS